MSEAIRFLRDKNAYVRLRIYDPDAPKEESVYPRFLPEHKHDAVAKTLICIAGKKPFCIVLGYGRRANLKELSKELATPRFQLVKPEAVIGFTGYKIGSVCPIMPGRQIDTVFDKALTRHPYIYINAGEPGAQIRVCTNTLLDILNAKIIAFSVAN